MQVSSLWRELMITFRQTEGSVKDASEYRKRQEIIRIANLIVDSPKSPEKANLAGEEEAEKKQRQNSRSPSVCHMKKRKQNLLSLVSFWKMNL